MTFADDLCDAYGVSLEDPGGPCLSAYQKERLWERLNAGASLTLTERGYIATGRLGAEAMGILGSQGQPLPPVSTVVVPMWWALVVLGVVYVASQPRRR